MKRFLLLFALVLTVCSTAMAEDLNNESPVGTIGTLDGREAMVVDLGGSIGKVAIATMNVGATDYYDQGTFFNLKDADDPSKTGLADDWYIPSDVEMDALMDISHLDLANDGEVRAVWNVTGTSALSIPLVSNSDNGYLAKCTKEGGVGSGILWTGYKLFINGEDLNIEYTYSNEDDLESTFLIRPFHKLPMVHTVTFIQGEWGYLKASVDGGSSFTSETIHAAEGTTIILNPGADPFHEFSGWITTPSEFVENIDINNHFEMPAYDVFIEATYSPRTTYAIKVYYDNECGTASVTYEGVGIGAAPVGLPLTLSATPDADHAFDCWRIYDGKNEVRLYEANTTFEMIAPEDPSRPLIFEAYFYARPTYRVNISNTIQNGTVVANPTRCYSGTTVTLTPQAASGYQYVYGGISVVDGKGNAVSVNQTDNGGTFTMPNSDVTVSATFKKLYNVSMGTVQNGSAYAMPGSAVSGALVSVYVTPNTGCVVYSVRADYDGGFVPTLYEYISEDGQHAYMFEMPEKDVTVKVDILKTFTVSYTQSTGGTFSVSPTTNVMESQRVGIEITAIDLYYSFDYANYESKISVTDASGNPVCVYKQSDGQYYFSMPVSNATVSVTFDADPNNNITANQDPAHKQNYYSTFYSSTCDYQVPSGVTAYTGAVDGDVLKLTAIESGIIPAGEAVILRLTSEEDITATKQQFDLTAMTTTATKSGTNALTGTDVAKTLAANDYALSLGQNGVGFYLWKDKEIGANKAYLTLNASFGAKAFTFQFDDDPTGIEEASPISSPEGKELMYDLNGVRVDNSYKGVVIKNGKKVLQK